jgi:hypothetical protein
MVPLVFTERFDILKFVGVFEALPISAWSFLIVFALVSALKISQDSFGVDTDAN